jgi:TatA/E family protein of Tat protein translocase
MFNVGPLEIVLVLVIALIVLGPQKLPDVARSVGKGMREFRTAISEVGDYSDHADDEDDDPAETDDVAKKAREKRDAKELPEGS